MVWVYVGDMSVCVLWVYELCICLCMCVVGCMYGVCLWVGGCMLWVCVWVYVVCICVMWAYGYMYSFGLYGWYGHVGVCVVWVYVWYGCR